MCLFLKIIGDQIYSDNPVYFGAEKKYYEAKYRELLSDPYFAELASRKPLYHMCTLSIIFFCFSWLWIFDLYLLQTSH
jgi:hypothetical protein